jgi:hypothetical protein
MLTDGDHEPCHHTEETAGMLTDGGIDRLVD